MDMGILAVGIMLACAAIGGAVGNAILFSKYIEGITRQPEAQPTLFGQTLLLFAIVELMPIAALGISLYLLFVRGV